MVSCGALVSTRPVVSWVTKYPYVPKYKDLVYIDTEYNLSIHLGTEWHAVRTAAVLL